MRPVLTVALLVVFISPTACSKKPSKDEASVSSNAGKIVHLETEIRSLRRDLLKVQARESRYDSVSLDPTEKGYGRIDTSSGFFLIAVHSVEPYLDGYKLHLRIGNPTAARYNGFKLTVSWQKPYPEQRQGESDDELSKRQEQWLQEQPHQKEFSFTETLQPSSWNSVSLIVSPATAEEIKELTITSMETDQVVLAVR